VAVHTLQLGTQLYFVFNPVKLEYFCKIGLILVVRYIDYIAIILDNCIVDLLDYFLEYDYITRYLLNVMIMIKYLQMKPFKSF
jgi:hypothetical protein